MYLCVGGMNDGKPCWGTVGAADAVCGAVGCSRPWLAASKLARISSRIARLEARSIPASDGPSGGATVPAGEFIGFKPAVGGTGTVRTVRGVSSDAEGEGTTPPGKLVCVRPGAPVNA